MGRPSPRTQGVTEEGETFQKFGTQQLKYLDPEKPALGVTQVNTGQQFKGLTTSGYTGTLSTAFSQQFQAGITGHQSIMPRAEAIKMQDAKLAEMGIPKFPDLGLEFPDLGDLFGGGDIDKHGCECEACKNGTGQCSDKRAECDAWDLGCELGGGFTDIITDPVSSWWEKYGIWVYVILGVIGLGILLWLLRPLFGVAKNITGISKSAVTRVNGMK
tara:strand:- start:6 stop:653 length:648 start_codon:yes stop_codon:yes gene_type:complete